VLSKEAVILVFVPESPYDPCFFFDSFYISFCEDLLVEIFVGTKISEV